MDSLYRGQRHIYDATRKYYLFGRDRMIDRLDCRPGDTVLEIGCGTGRNLARIARRWPGVELHGLDISAEMLKSAAARLGETARLAQGDATSFDAAQLFDRKGFDRVVISFALSMVPDWRAAVRQAAEVLAPGGALHIVDFGDCRGLPAPARGLLQRWLAHFHVAPRLDLPDFAHSLTAQRELSCRARRGPLGYYALVRIERRPSRRTI